MKLRMPLIVASYLGNLKDCGEMILSFLQASPQSSFTLKTILRNEIDPLYYNILVFCFYGEDEIVLSFFQSESMNNRNKRWIVYEPGKLPYFILI